MSSSLRAIGVIVVVVGLTTNSTDHHAKMLAHCVVQAEANGSLGVDVRTTMMNRPKFACWRSEGKEYIKFNLAGRRMWLLETRQKFASSEANEQSVASPISRHGIRFGRFDKAMRWEGWCRRQSNTYLQRLMYCYGTHHDDDGSGEGVWRVWQRRWVGGVNQGRQAMQEFLRRGFRLHSRRPPQ